MPPSAILAQLRLNATASGELYLPGLGGGVLVGVLGWGGLPGGSLRLLGVGQNLNEPVLAVQQTRGGLISAFDGRGGSVASPVCSYSAAGRFQLKSLSGTAVLIFKRLCDHGDVKAPPTLQLL